MILENQIIVLGIGKRRERIEHYPVLSVRIILKGNQIVNEGIFLFMEGMIE